MTTKELKQRKKRQIEEVKINERDRLESEIKESIEIFISAVSQIDHLDMAWSRESQSMVLNMARAIQIFVEGSTDTLYRNRKGSGHRTE